MRQKLKDWTCKISKLAIIALKFCSCQFKETLKRNEDHMNDESQQEKKSWDTIQRIEPHWENPLSSTVTSSAATTPLNSATRAANRTCFSTFSSSRSRSIRQRGSQSPYSWNDLFFFTTVTYAYHYNIIKDVAWYISKDRKRNVNNK